MTIDEVLDKLDSLARVLRTKARNTPRDIDQQIADAKAESYETAAGLVRQITVLSSCPDGGTCHHGCIRGRTCFRVVVAEPLSGVYPYDEWPADVVKERG